jgi:hypothetical protein
MVQNPMVLHHARRGIAGKSRMNLIGHVAKWVEFTRTLDGFEPRRHDGHNGGASEGFCENHPSGSSGLISKKKAAGRKHSRSESEERKKLERLKVGA